MYSAHRYNAVNYGTEIKKKSSYIILETFAVTVGYRLFSAHLTYSGAVETLQKRFSSTVPI